MPIIFSVQKLWNIPFNVLLVSILLIPCCAAVENTNCTSDANCTTINSECDTSISRCRCLIGYYVDGINCQPKLAPGGGCSQDVQCIANAECSTTENKCRCNENYVDNVLTDSGVGGVCALKKDLGDTCTAPGTTSECSDSFSSCTSESGGNKCRCTANYYDSDLDNSNVGGTCTPKKELGVACTNSVQCLDWNSQCGLWSGNSVCNCKTGYYDSNNNNLGGTCNELNELKVWNPTLTLRSETYLEIEWAVPAATGAIEEFRYQVGTGTVISVNKESTANITGLTPGNMYTIKVISVDTNSSPNEQTAYIQISIATQPAVPGPIDLVKSNFTASDGQITIKWKYTGTVMSYTVTISELVQNPTVVNNPFFVIGGNAAKNGYRYTLTVKAHSNSLESAEYTEEFRTVITQPNPPIVPATCNEDDRKSTSIYVRWQAPAYPNGDILYYLVDTVSGPSTVPQLNTSINVLVQKVGPLLEERQYCFKVKTVNDGPDNIRTSVPSHQQPCCFTKAAMSTVPTSVIHSTTSRSIRISWSKPVDSKGAIVGYRLRFLSNIVCVVEVLLGCNSGCTNVLIQHKCASDKILIREDRNSTQLMSSMSYVIDQLLPYTYYDVWINAINPAGDGDRNETSVQTDPEVPQKPISVVASVVSSSEITVTWNQPSPRPGVTTYYIKAYEVVLNSQPKFVTFSNLTGFSQQTTTFSGLEAYWNYTFSVVAATDKGNSEQSEMSVTVITHQDAPGKVTNFEIKIPTNTLTTMQVSWAIPLLRDRNGIIKEYRISHNISGTTTLETITSEFEIFHKLYYITPDRHYKVELYAVNTINQFGQKVQMIYHAIPKSETQLPDNGYSIGTVVGAAVGSVLFSILGMVVVVCLILNGRKNKTIKKSGPRQAHEEPKDGDQYEDLGMDNISSYQERGAKDNPNVYDQIGRVHTVDKHYENMLP